MPPVSLGKAHGNGEASSPIGMPEVIYGAKGNALRIGCASKEARPELVFIVGARPDISEDAKLQPQSRSGNGAGIVRVSGARGPEVDAAQLNQIFCVEAEVTAVSKARISSKTATTATVKIDRARSSRRMPVAAH